MVRTFIDSFDKDQILMEFDSFLLIQNDQYVAVYKYFVNFFDSKDILNIDDVIVGASFTYSWMPTILNFKVADFDAGAFEATKLLNKLKKVKSTLELSDQEYKMIEEIKPFINNSLVGTSKLLHFVNPEVFPIWDSRVYSFLRGKEGKKNATHLSSIEYYKSYINLCSRVVREKPFENFHRQYEQKYRV